jgi:hypothetical protein
VSPGVAGSTGLCPCGVIGTDEDTKGAPPVDATGRPEKTTVPSAMRVSMPWEVPAGVSEVMRQEPTKPWSVAAGVPVWHDCRAARSRVQKWRRRGAKRDWARDA